MEKIVRKIRAKSPSKATALILIVRTLRKICNLGAKHTIIVNTPPIKQDVSLMKEFFELKCRYEDMSPVLIPSGYTRDYIDGKIAAGEQLKDVRSSFQVKGPKGARK